MKTKGKFTFISRDGYETEILVQYADGREFNTVRIQSMRKAVA